MPRNIIYASAQDVEKFLRGSLKDTIITKIEPTKGMTSFRLESIVYKDDALTQKVKVDWGDITVLEMNGETRVVKRLNVDYIYKSFAWDDMRREEDINAFGETLNTVYADILEFRSPHAFDEKKLTEVKDLSEKRVPIKTIANRVNLSRSQVIRYRDHLGVTNKRRKK